MNWFDLISALLGLGCVFLAGRQRVANFWLGYAYNLFLFVLFFFSGLYASMMVQLVSLGINAYGHWRWTHPAAEETGNNGALAVSRIPVDRYWVYIVSTLGCFGILVVVLIHTWDPQPVMDAACTSMILLAQVLSAQKKVECWWVWLVVNIMNLILYILAGLDFMPIVASLYLINGIWSLRSWKKNGRDTEDK